MRRQTARSRRETASAGAGGSGGGVPKDSWDSATTIRNAGGAVGIVISGPAQLLHVVITATNFTETGVLGGTSVEGGAVGLVFSGSHEKGSVLVQDCNFEGSSVAGNALDCRGGALSLRADNLTSASVRVTGGGAAQSLVSSGNGGAVAISMFSATNVSVDVGQMIFADNQAQADALSRSQGGSLYLHLPSVVDSTITLHDLIFSTENADLGAGMALHLGDVLRLTVLVDNVTMANEVGDFGGALSVFGDDADTDSSNLTDFHMEIRNSHFDGCVSNGGVGGTVALFVKTCQQSSVLIDGVLIEYASAGSGGAIGVAPSIATDYVSDEYMCQMDIVISNTAIFRPSADTYGGALFVDANQLSGLNVTIIDSMITDATAGNGGAVAVQAAVNSSLQIINSTISDNRAKESGGAMQLDGNIRLLLDSVQFLRNSAANNALLEARGLESTLTLRNCTAVANPNNIANQIYVISYIISGDAPDFILCAPGSHTIVATNVSLRLWTVDCLPCARGFYQRSICAGQECLACPPGADCESGTALQADPGYWACTASDECSLKMYECPQGFCLGNNECAAGHDTSPDNVLCGRCAPGYDRVGSDCVDCSSGSAAGKGVGIFSALLAMVVLIIVLGAIPDLTASKKIFFYFFQTLNIVIGPTSSWASWTGYFNLSLAKYLCLHTSSSTQMLWLQLAEPLSYFVLWFALLVLHWLFFARPCRPRSSYAPLAGGEEETGDNNNYNNSGGARGSIAGGRSTSLLQHLLDIHPHSPGKSTVQADEEDRAHASAPAGDGHRETHSAATGSVEEMRPQESTLKRLAAEFCRRYRFVRALQFLLLFSFESLTEQSLQLINCVDVGACGRVLAEYPDVSCSSSAYQPLRVVAICILVYAVVFPLLLLAMLYRIDRQHDTLSATAAVRTEARFGVFYDHYRRRFWWWEVQVLARRLLLLAVYVARFTAITERSYGILVVCLGILFAHMLCRPFRHSLDNTLESLSLAMLTYAAATKAVYQDGVFVDAMHNTIIAVLCVVAVIALWDVMRRYALLLPSRLRRYVPLPLEH
eukprot:m.202109 g.202109  ORF g.202109 m.202109 type:complete len:1051 (-) comp17716_c0_seq6:1639-4791(-)